MIKIRYLIILIFILKLGFFIDISDDKIVKNVDVIVILGGGDEARIIKGIELYFDSKSNSNKFVFTGNDFCNGSLWFLTKTELLLQSGVKNSNIVQINAENTYTELLRLKEYLIKNNFKTVIIVTHPTHTRRIDIMSSVLFDYDKENIKLLYIAADHTNVWNKNLYFLKLESLKLIFLEILKIFYNLIKYTVFL